MGNTKKQKEWSEYENKVFEYFSSLLKKGEVPGANKYSKIFQHKTYISQDGVKKTDFDISIETYNPNSKDKEWSSLILIECKCYNHKVNMAYFDAFENKIRKMSDSGIKGIMVTNEGFTSTEIDMARKSHIGLVILSDNGVNWIVSRDLNYKSEDLMEILHGRLKPGTIPVTYYDNNFYNLIDLLKNSGAVVEERRFINIPFLDKSYIKDCVSDLYKKYNLSSDNIANELLNKKYQNYTIKYSDLPIGLLGELSLTDNVITLSEEIKDNIHRRNFTLAHEIGHIYLHQDLLKSCINKIHEYGTETTNMFPDNIVKRMEIQANTFASYLLMPEAKFIRHVNYLFDKLYITTNRLYLDYQPCNINDVNLALGYLSQKFNVSKEAVRWRLVNDNLLVIGDDEPKRVERFIPPFTYD